MNNEKQTEDAAELWCRKSRQLLLAEAVDLELPSGAVIKARRPGPGLMAGWGRLPLGLAAAASDAAVQSDEDARTTAAFLRDLILYCVVEPVISLNPRLGEIHPRNIADADTNYILAWAIRGEEVASLESFRPKRADEVTGGNGAGIPRASVRSAGHKGPRRSTRPRSGSHGGSQSAKG